MKKVINVSSLKKDSSKKTLVQTAIKCVGQNKKNRASSKKSKKSDIQSIHNKLQAPQPSKKQNNLPAKHSERLKKPNPIRKSPSKQDLEETKGKNLLKKTQSKNQFQEDNINIIQNVYVNTKKASQEVQENSGGNRDSTKKTVEKRLGEEEGSMQKKIQQLQQENQDMRNQQIEIDQLLLKNFAILEEKIKKPIIKQLNQVSLVD